MTVALLGACQPNTEAKKAPPPPVVVSAAPVVREDAPLWLRCVGYVQAMATVTIKPQVTGILKDVLVEEGQEVKAGQVLFVIDPAMFQAALKEAEAGHARDVVGAERAEMDLRRYQGLVHRDYVSQSAFETQQAAARQAKETVRLAEAKLEAARLNLGYCTIRSPLNAVAGLLKVKAGNLVIEKQDSLVTLNQVRPIQVRLSLPQRELDLLRQAMVAGSPVVKANPAGESWAEEGRLTVLNNEVDTKTGMITALAEFPNRDKRLWPGQFVETEVMVAIQRQALLVPNQALLPRQDGVFVFVVREDRQVELRQVERGRALGERTLVVSGLREGEQVVTSGQVKLTPGSKVVLREAGGGEAPAQRREGGSPATS